LPSPFGLVQLPGIVRHLALRPERDDRKTASLGVEFVDDEPADTADLSTLRAFIRSHHREVFEGDILVEPSAV
jgi:hypothetical protein